LIRRYGAKWPLAIGPALACGSLVSLALWHDQPWQILLALFALGIGVPFTSTAAQHMVLSSVRPTESGVASGITSVMRSLGMALAAQVTAAVLTASTIAGTDTPTESAFVAVFVAVAVVSGVAAALALGAAPGRQPRVIASAEGPDGALSTSPRHASSGAGSR
jgi:predicted MFS family arabinose efflux permease